MELIWPILGGGFSKVDPGRQIIGHLRQSDPSVAEVIAKTVRRMKCYQEFCRADAMRTFARRNDGHFGKFNKGAKWAFAMAESDRVGNGKR